MWVLDSQFVWDLTTLLSRKMERSGGGSVYIRNTNDKTAGKYKCEISVEGTFHTVAAEKMMMVFSKFLAFLATFIQFVILDAASSPTLLCMTVVLICLALVYLVPWGSHARSLSLFSFAMFVLSRPHPSLYISHSSVSLPFKPIKFLKLMSHFYCSIWWKNKMKIFEIFEEEQRTWKNTKRDVSLAEPVTSYFHSRDISASKIKNSTHDQNLNTQPPTPKIFSRILSLVDFVCNNRKEWDRYI